MVALGQEVLEHLRGLLGADALLAAYTASRDAARAARMERKRRAAQGAVLDPEAAARRRIQKVCN